MTKLLIMPYLLPAQPRNYHLIVFVSKIRE